jgi:hypothetical protein
MRKISTMRTSGKNIFQGQLTIAVDLGRRFAGRRKYLATVDCATAIPNLSSSP